MILEICFTALVLTTGVGLVGNRWRTKPPGKIGWSFVMLVCVCGATAWAWSNDQVQIANQEQEQKQEQQHQKQLDLRPISTDDGGYVSSDQCRECHPHQHSTWYASHHRTMTQLPTEASVIANFEGKQVIRYGGQEFRFFKRDGEFYMAMKAAGRQQAENDLNQKKDDESNSVREFKLVLSTGAHHQQAFWWATDEGRTLGKLPFVWINAEQRWVPYSSIFLIPSSGRQNMRKGAWNRSCLKCHVVQGRPRFDSESKTYDTHVAEFGISCGACHGPGKAHAAFHRDPSKFSEEDDTLINPKNLSHQRASHTCGQCHSSFGFHDEESEEAFDHEGFAYRPGDDLHESRFIFRRGRNEEHPAVKKKLAKDPEFYDKQFWSDGMVRVSGREYNGLLETPCFQHGTMSCLSCHEMHPQKDDQRTKAEWANDQLKPGMRGDESCLQCHEEYRSDERLALHTHHLSNSAGSRCYNCHMPHTTLGLMKAMRSHTVDSPSVAATVATGRPNACNLCHLDQTLQWTSDHLSQWYQIESPELSQEEKEVASSVRWLLKGDAGQRAIIGWHLGWGPAQAASGTSWMAPYLAELLTDSYDVVRFIGYHSLESLPGFADFKYDYVAPPQIRQQNRERVMKLWREQSERPSDSAPILIDGNGEIIEALYENMRNKRLDPPVILNE